MKDSKRERVHIKFRIFALSCSLSISSLLSPFLSLLRFLSFSLSVSFTLSRRALYYTFPLCLSFCLVCPSSLSLSVSLFYALSHTLALHPRLCILPFSYPPFSNLTLCFVLQTDTSLLLERAGRSHLPTGTIKLPLPINSRLFHSSSLYPYSSPTGNRRGFCRRKGGRE